MDRLRAIVKGSAVGGINQGDAIPRESVCVMELQRQIRFPLDGLIRV